MNVNAFDAAVLSALHREDVPPDHLAAVSDRSRPLAGRLAGMPIPDRSQAFQAALAVFPKDDADALAEAVMAHGVKPLPPIPIEGTGLDDLEAADGWGPSRLAERPKAGPFPLDVLPPRVATFCREVSESTRAPVDFVATAMLATAGAAIGQSVNVRLKRGWTEAPLLYAAVVGDPGAAKTPAIRAAVRPLVAIDERLRVESMEARERWAEAKKAHDRDESAPPPGPEPPQLRAVVKDITRESLCIVMRDNPRGVLCATDELTAWVGSFDQYKGKGTDRQFWLSLYTGDAVSVDRKGGRESIHVPHPFAAVLGGVQPDVLAGLRSERDDGFLDRIAFAYPDDLPRQRWTEGGVSEEAERDWADVVERLHAVPMRPDDGDAPRPWLADLDPAAKRRFVMWYDAQGEAMDDPERSDGRRGAMSKARALVARLALILSRMRLACDPARPLLDSQGVPPVEDADMEGAIRLAAYMENHRERAVGRMTRGAAGADAETVLAWIKRRGLPEFREADVKDDLRRRFGADDGPDALKAALAALEGRGAIRPKAEPAIQGKRGRKPSPAYEVHPDLL